MVSIVLASVLAAGAAAIVCLGLAVMAFRRRPVRIVDYPELPAPPRKAPAREGGGEQGPPG
jgi:hypothetical protein